jgi:hypothetical protein
VLDLDALSIGQFDDLKSLLQGTRAILYTTPSDDSETYVCKARVVVALDRELAPDECESFRRGLAVALGVEADRSTLSDPSRGFFMGRFEQDPAREFIEFDGEPIAVEEVLNCASTTVREDPSTTPTPDSHDPLLSDVEHQQITDVLEPACFDGQKHQLAKALGGWARQRGYSRGDVECVIGLLGFEKPDDRLKAALACFEAPRVNGYHGLLELGVDKEALDALPNPRWDAETPNDVVDERPLSKADLKTSANVEQVLTTHLDWQGVLAYDAFGCRVVCLREPPARFGVAKRGVGVWTEADTVRTQHWFFDLFRVEPGKDAIDGAVEVAARRNTFHPVADYLRALTWDGVQRLNAMLATYFGAAETAYTSTVGAKFMISAVARALKPGCKVDTMLILEGRQGTFKSSGVAALAGGSEWFADTALNFGDKDAAQCLQGKWIYEIGELHAFRRAEVTEIKAFVSSPSDNLRPSYGRRNQDFPRQCVFVGTTNSDKYLADTTGNRRFWPVSCGRVDVEAISRDRDQLWAEAVARYGDGSGEYLWWLTPAETRLAEVQQEDRETSDAWEELIAEWINGTSTHPKLGLPGGRRSEFTLADALSGALGVDPAHQTQSDSMRVGRILSKLGWRTIRKRVGPRSDNLFARVYVER